MLCLCGLPEVRGGFEWESSEGRGQGKLGSTFIPSVPAD